MRLSLWVIFFALSSSLPAAELFEPEAVHSTCWGPQCRIEVDTRPFTRQIAENPEAKYDTCPHGIPLPKDGKLPPGHVAVGPKKDTYILPIHSNPEAFLEEGDILIDAHGDSLNLYDVLTEGRSHAKIVGKYNGHFVHYDSPMTMSGTNFRSGQYHILRARKYPPGVKSAKDLAEWQADPARAKELEEWTQKRTERIQRIMKKIETLAENGGWNYDSQRRTEAKKPKEMEPWVKDFNAQCKIGKPSVYCSEFPIFLYATEKEKVPAAVVVFRMLDKIADEELPRIMRNEKKTLSQVLDQEFTRIFHQFEPVLGQVPEANKEAIKTAIKAYVSVPKSARGIARAGIETMLLAKDEEIPISPSDIFHNIFDEKDGFLSYAGTYVGSCAGGNAYRMDLAVALRTAEREGNGLPPALTRAIRGGEDHRIRGGGLGIRPDQGEMLIGDNRNRVGERENRELNELLMALLNERENDRPRQLEQGESERLQRMIQDLQTAQRAVVRDRREEIEEERVISLREATSQYNQQIQFLRNQAQATPDESRRQQVQQYMASLTQDHQRRVAAINSRFDARLTRLEGGGGGEEGEGSGDGRAEEPQMPPPPQLQPYSAGQGGSQAAYGYRYGNRPQQMTPSVLNRLGTQSPAVRGRMGQLPRGRTP